MENAMTWTAEDEQAWQEWQKLAVLVDAYYRCTRWIDGCRCWEGFEPVLLPNEDSGYSLLQVEAIHFPESAEARGNVAP